MLDSTWGLNVGNDPTLSPWTDSLWYADGPNSWF